jgi:hypothetical protein
LIKVEVIGKREDREGETIEVYFVQLPLGANGHDAVSFVNALLWGWLLPGMRYEMITHFDVSAVWSSAAARRYRAKLLQYRPEVVCHL